MSEIIGSRLTTSPVADDKLLEVKNLKKYFSITKSLLSRKEASIKAVDGVSFFVFKGETLGIVGESGCGKTTLGKVILRLIEATEGEVIFEGRNILTLKHEEMRKLRRKMQIIFQDPYASLSPRMNVGDIIGEPLGVFGVARGVEKEKLVLKLLGTVGLPSHIINRYPHEFSGGQRQRIGIARALALNPKLIVCDEPVSNLDVSIQSQILNLLSDLQKKLGLTYLFIAHNLSIISYISDHVGVMYLGKMVEIAGSEEIFQNPMHPYTEALLSAIPVMNPEIKRERIVLEGDVPSPVNPPKGCRFSTRCQYKQDICSEQEPDFVDIGNKHFLACHLRGK